MARTVLPNGTILPAEYSDDWYEDMTSNLNKLDDVIGSDSEKLNSNDVAFLRMSSAALTDGGTGNFSDLNSSNKLKTGDYVLDSGRKLYQVVSVDSTNERFTVGNSLFKVTAESDLAPVAESGDYDDLDNKPDLNPYDQHIVNTDIHVTTADKTKWNNGVSQSYVLRYSSSSVTDNSTIAYSTLDNTDNIKADDKIIDVDGKIFSIVSVDSDNSTVTVGTALIDLALDANVVHTSGDETINGVKSFINYFFGKDLSGQTVDLNDCVDAYGGAIHYYYAVSNYTNISNKPENKPFILESKTVRYVSSVDYIYYQKIYTADYNASPSIYTRYYRSGSASWSNWIKDTDKFVTTDTTQTISGAKTFSSTPVIYNSDVNGSTQNLYFRNQLVTKGDTSTSGSQLIRFSDSADKMLSRIQTSKVSNGSTTLNLRADTVDTNNNDVTTEIQLISGRDGSKSLSPQNDNAINLGRISAKWKNLYINQINGLTPSSLSLPANRANSIDISGYFTQTGSDDTNTYDVLANGYIYLQLANVVTVHCFTFEGSSSVATYIQTFSRGNDGQLYVLFPVRKNDTFKSTWYTGSTVTVNKAMFIPCQGNI